MLVGRVNLDSLLLLLLKKSKNYEFSVACSPKSARIGTRQSSKFPLYNEEMICY